MTLWSSPHPKESTALNLGQGVDGGKIKELVEPGTVMPSSATSFASDSSEDAGFEDGSIDVDMGEEETEGEGIQIDCIQTLTEFDPINDGDYRSGGSPVMADYKTPIPLPPPPMQIGSAFGGNQAYGNIQNTLPRMIDRPQSPMQAYWSGNNAGDTGVHPSRAPGDVGLNNIGNTCFMNSGLQCLLHTSPLVDFFVGRSSFEKSGTSLVYQFHSLMSHVWFGNKGAISLHDFKLVLGNNYVQFKDCRQHDCQEFLAVLLDLLHEEMKLKQKPALSIADSSVGQSYIEDCTEFDNVVGSHDDVDKRDTPSNIAESTSKGDNEDAKNVSRPSSKRLKLENHSSVGTDSGLEKNDESSEDSEVKRKSPLPRQENSISNDACDIDMKNVQENQVGEGNNAEGSSGTENVISNSNNCPVQKAKDSWDSYMKDNNTVIASTFQGMFKSAVTCSECNYISELYEPFMYLSLPIPRVMEKTFNVTLISLKDRSQTKVEVTHHLMGTVSQLIQAVVKKANSCGGLDVQTKYAAAEVFNHRISRILDEKMQLRSVTTNSRNIYVYELNDNFHDSNENSYILDIPPTLESCNIMTSVSGRQQVKASSTSECDRDESSERQDASTSASSTSTYGPVGAPVGGGFYDITSSSLTHVPHAEDGLPQIDNEKFNQVQCNICLEDYSRSELKKHVGCSCVLCEGCLNKSVEHFQAESTADTTQQGSLLRCAVCLQTVDCKRTFVSLSESLTPSANAEFITIPIIFRSEAATDANNNSSWSPNLFGYPLLIRVPSFINAAEFVEYIETINPAPGVTHRLLSVKSDGKSCGQCVLSNRCSGCEIPREGMISLNSCNSILISFVDLPSERKEQMQPTDMVIQNELSQSWSYSRNEDPSIDIHDCLRTFSETEHLDEQNPWFCPKCEKNQRATKALSICKFPDYLIVYLKRFVFLDQSSNKLNNRLTFPINDLDVSDYVTEGFGADVGKYNLYSCVCHFGSASAGHYTAFAKNPVTNQWHYFNDDSISERVPGDSEYSSAYVLFYEKQGMGCNIPSKCNRPLPELNSFNITSTVKADTRGSYLPGESTVSADPVRVGDFGNEMNLQVDSTSADFSFPHSSTEADLAGLEVDEGVGNDTTPLLEIRDGLGLGCGDAVMVSSSTPGVENEVVDGNEIASDNFSCSNNTISTSNQTAKASSSAASADSTSN